MNIAHLLRGSAQEFRDLPALARGTSPHLTYRDLWRRVSVMSTHLAARFGLVRGDRVAFAMANCVESIEVMYAIWHAGLCAVPMNAKLHAREFAFILENSGAKLCFVTPDLADTIAEAAKEAPALKEIVDVTTRSYTFMAVGDPSPIADAEPTDLAWLFYTSGTTGRPKGVQRVAASAEQQVRMQALRSAMYQITPDSRVAVPGPLYHAFPNQMALHAATLAAHLEIMPRFDPEAFLALVERERITSVGLAPIMFVRLLRLPEAVRKAYDLSSLRWAIHAGGPCAPDVKRAMIDWWGPIIAEYYGGTETGPLTLCDSAEWLAHPGTCGKPVAGAELRIVGPDGHDVPRGSTGEIYGRLHDYPDFTYRGDPAKRAEVALGDLITLGDVGYQDAEGYLYLCDRVRDMVVSGGVNIYPAEVEGALFALDGVSDCAVIGVPDAEYGEAVVALVSGTGLDPQVLRAQLKDRIAGYKVPREIVIVSALERDASGKLRKGGLRDRYLAGWRG